MPLIKEDYRTPILVYDALVDEKTKELRKKFDVDEETGYPRMYNWRPMARLGREYRPEDVFTKFDPWTPEKGYSTQVGLVATVTAFLGIGHLFLARYSRRPVWSKALPSIGLWGATCAFLLWAHEKSLERQGFKNGIYLDYMRQHPDRFEPIYRPKFREVLFYYVPVR